MNDQTIYKYDIELDGGYTDIALPGAARVLNVAVDEASKRPVVWIQLNPAHPKVRTLKLQVVVTGGGVPLADYVGTFQVQDQDGSNFVGHVFSNWA